MVNPQEHAEHRGWIESILRHLPGFHGYLEAEYRRESDSLTRTFLAQRLSTCRRNLQAYQQNLVNVGNLDDLTQTERADAAILALGNRVLGEVRGYSGFFDFVQIDTALLERVYQHDLALLNDAETLVTVSAQLSNAVGDSRTLSANLKTLVDALTEKFSERGQMLQGLDSTKR